MRERWDYDEIGRALDACYDAITTPETWADALHRLSRSINAAASMFFPKDINADAADMPASRDYQDFLAHYVQQGWYDGHYRAERGWPLLKTRSVVIEHDLATDDERKKLRHYQDLYLKWGYPGFAAVGFVVDDQAWCVPFLRSTSQGFFTHDEAALLASFGNHFSRMVRLSKRFVHARASTGLEALDRVDRGAILIDGNGRVIDLNKVAEDMLTRHQDTLVLKNGRLRALRSSSNMRLQKLIAASVTSQAVERPMQESSPIFIEKPLGMPLIAEAVSIRDLVTLVSHTAHTILLLSDMDKRPRSKFSALSSVFGLTPAEMRLCEMMLAGCSLSEAADRLEITSNTARQRLKTVFHKTSTHRQGELLLLLSSF